MTTLLNPRLEEREYIFTIGKALMAEMELNEVLRVILQAATELTASRAGVVILAEPSESVFRVVATYGIPPRILNQYPSLRCGIPYGDGQIEALNAVKRQVKTLVEATNSTLIKSIGLPMYNGEAIIGVIFVFHDHEHIISGNMGRFLQSFAAWAAIAVKNARLYEAVMAEKQRLNAIIHQSADGVMILDQSLHITTVNAALSRMTGLNSAESCHQCHHNLIHLKNLRTENDLYSALSKGWPLQNNEPLYVEGDFIKGDGSSIALGITYAPLVNERGLMTNIIANVRDLTRYREEEQLQKTFISVVSHELKTPVSIIKGYAGTLLRDDVEWPRSILNEYLHTIIEEADSLTDLIDNLLEASRLQSGTFRLSLNNELSLPSLIRNVVKKFDAQKTAKHQLLVEFSADFPEIQGDERRLTQVFNNLISNAMKYSPEGTQIIVSGKAFADHVLIHVRDNGIGIPEHEQHRIFQKFSRLDNALSRKTDGTGLGLYLTKSIIEAHGGKIWFESNAPETGTTFSFSLPLENNNNALATGTK